MMLTFRLEVGSIRLVLVKDGKESPVFHIGRGSRAGSTTSREDHSANDPAADGEVVGGSRV
jgi:hypothetical protein